MLCCGSFVLILIKKSFTFYNSHWRLEPLVRRVRSRSDIFYSHECASKFLSYLKAIDFNALQQHGLSYKIKKNAHSAFSARERIAQQ